MSFKLPVFSPDIEKCIQKDAFYTSAQRNKLIREACMALRAHCRGGGSPVMNEAKKKLAKQLYDLVSKSLEDPKSTAKDQRYDRLCLSVIICCMYSQISFY